jgi:Ca2+-binding EF-hand superfamily protein
MEYLERTETAGNYINTPIGESKVEAAKVKDVVATMTFPSEQLIEMFKDYTMTDDQVEQIIQNYDFEDVIESGLSNHDWNDEVENVLNSIDLEDHLDMDTIASNLDYKDIAREVGNYLDEPDALALAEELLTSFNYDSPCHTGSLYIKSVEAIIEGYMKKQTEGIVQPTVIEENKETIITYTVKEINEVLESLQYTEYNKSRILTALSLKERG